jgi:hypothetical protein
MYSSSSYAAASSALCAHLIGVALLLVLTLNRGTEAMAGNTMIDALVIPTGILSGFEHIQE